MWNRANTQQIETCHRQGERMKGPRTATGSTRPESEYLLSNYSQNTLNPQEWGLFRGLTDAICVSTIRLLPLDIVTKGDTLSKSHPKTQQSMSYNSLPTALSAVKNNKSPKKIYISLLFWSIISKKWLITILSSLPLSSGQHITA